MAVPARDLGCKELNTHCNLMNVCVLFVAGHQKQVGPELFRVFYTIWKETEVEAQEVRV